MAVLSLNDRALRVADELAGRADELGAAVHQVGGARIIDAGVKALGSLDAGCIMANICMADLGKATITPVPIGPTVVPGLMVNVRFPVAACMASQYAGWQISLDDYFAMGSGPMRAAYGKEELFDVIGFRERTGCVVGVLESAQLPDAAVVEKIAECCGVKTSQVTLVAARTASLSGGVQIAARSVETALHKLHILGFDLSRIVGGFGVAPLPPVAADDMAAIGRTNDAVLYGGQCTLYVTGDDRSLEQITPQLPSTASKDYGEPFAKIFQRYDHDFYKIDPMLFSPAQVSLQNIDSGRTHMVGRVNHEILSRSFIDR